MILWSRLSVIRRMVVRRSTCSCGWSVVLAGVSLLLLRACSWICCSRCIACCSSLFSWLVRKVCGVLESCCSTCCCSLSLCCRLGVRDLCESSCDCVASGVNVGLLELLVSCSACSMSACAAANSC